MKFKTYSYRALIIFMLVFVFIGGYTLVNRALCDHIFSNYISDENASYFSDGTKTAACDKGCGKKEKVKDTGSQLMLSKPENLIAVQTTEAITLSWNNVPDATGYSIYRMNIDGSEELIDSTNKTEHIVENLVSASKLRFSVKAYIKEGKECFWSDDAEIYTSTKCENVKNITSTSTSSAVKLTWDEVEGADGYAVFLKKSDKWESVCKNTEDTSFAVKDLSSGETYTFAVQAYVETDSVVFSDYESHEATTRLKAPETKIELLAKNEIKLIFKSVEKAEGYQIYRKINSEKFELLKETEIASDISFSLESDNYYTYAVRGYLKLEDEIIYGEYNAVKIHCSDTGDRVIVDPSEGKWNLVLVNKQRELPQNFVPELGDLPGGYSMDYRAAVYYNKMFDDAAEEGIYLSPISGYRSNEIQREIFDETVDDYIYSQDMTRSEAEKVTAKEVLFPGTSEHNLGLAVDVGFCSGSFGDSDEYRWLTENAYKYGFIERYTEEKQDITGIIPEPWHWRFVGTEYAEDIKNSGLCLEEYLEKYGLIP